MRTYEFRAETVEEALRNALKQLGAYEDEIEVKIIEKGSKGFLGIFGSKESIIEVSLLEKYSQRKLREYLDGILKNFDSEFFSEATLVGRTYRIKVEGEEISRLIGKHGKTVAALQHILSIYANRMSQIKVNVTVDVGDYRHERKRLVEEIAHRTAKTAISKKNKVVMEPMFAFERRLVHEVISQYQDLKSYSVGFEPYRKVVVEYREKRNGNIGNRHNTNSRRHYDSVGKSADR